jgi:hypothetical protein
VRLISALWTCCILTSYWLVKKWVDEDEQEGEPVKDEEMEGMGGMGGMPGMGGMGGMPGMGGMGGMPGMGGMGGMPGMGGMGGMPGMEGMGGMDLEKVRLALAVPRQ